MTRTCVAIGCTSPVLARRLCLTHYRQLASTGQACEEGSMIPPPPPQPLDDIVYTPGTELCVQRPDAWTDQDVYTQERAAATCLLCPLLDACRAAIDAMEPVWGTQDAIWAGETPGQRKRRRATGGTVHRARRVHVTAGPESGDWLTTRIPNARRKGWL